ncbi:MAG: shikimate dehydrogenase [Paludibacteraceae bacterium]|nr:shikimate dehydrogenase [Paludibacteraceae bacterium]
MERYGLIGKILVHSFSKNYFTEKFSREGIDARYDLFELPTIEEFPKLLETEGLHGLNVTIPYKEVVMPYLDELDDTAREIGAVNTIQFSKKGGKTHLKGFNTDAIGFETSLKPLLQPQHQKALVLGTGGASKAILYILKKLGIEPQLVSRQKREGMLTYEELGKEIVASHKLIVNCTPAGTFPKVDERPPFPTELLSDEHLVYDLIYNPEETLLCRLAKERGARTKNGLEMLHGQAVAAWKIWND